MHMSKNRSPKPSGNTGRTSSTSQTSAQPLVEVPGIVGHINKMICGKCLTGVSEGPIELIKEFLNGESFSEALSIGCGGAHKELEFVKQGLVDHFYLYELSEKNCALAKHRFESAGCGDKVTVINNDFFEDQPREFDLIHWDNSLHHMFNSRDAIAKHTNAFVLAVCSI